MFAVDVVRAVSLRQTAPMAKDKYMKSIEKEVSTRRLFESRCHSFIAS